MTRIRSSSNGWEKFVYKSEQTVVETIELIRSATHL